MEVQAVLSNDVEAAPLRQNYIPAGSEDPRLTAGYGRNTREMCSLIIRTAVVGFCMQLIVFGLPDMTREAGEPIHVSGMEWPYEVYAAFEIAHFLITCVLITMLYCMNSKLKWKMILFSEEAGSRGSMHFSGSSAVYTLFFSVAKISYILQPGEGKAKLDNMPAWAFGLLYVVDIIFYLVICVRQCISIRMDPFRNEPEDMLDTYFLPWDGHLSCRGLSSAYRTNVLPAEQLPGRDYWGEQAAREEAASGDTATRAVIFGAAPAGVAATQATYASAQSTVMADASVVATP